MKSMVDRQVLFFNILRPLHYLSLSVFCLSVFPLSYLSQLYQIAFTAEMHEWSVYDCISPDFFLVLISKLSLQCSESGDPGPLFDSFQLTSFFSPTQTFSFSSLPCSFFVSCIILHLLVTYILSQCLDRGRKQKTK